MNNAEIGKAMVIKLDPVLPEYPSWIRCFRSTLPSKRA